METIEKMLDSVPYEILGIPNEKGPTFRGICLCYSPKNSMWICGYGKSIDPMRDNSIVHYVGTGFSPIEAVDDFIKNCFKNHEISKR